MGWKCLFFVWLRVPWWRAHGVLMGERYLEGWLEAFKGRAIEMLWSFEGIRQWAGLLWSVSPCGAKVQH